jgi:hypothetical protein
MRFRREGGLGSSQYHQVHKFRRRFAKLFIPQCSYQSIPYKTVYKTAPWLEAGQQISSGGWDGEQKICNNQFGPPTVNTIVSPLDKTITTGTKVLPEYSAENDPQIYNDKNGSPDYK